MAMEQHPFFCNRQTQEPFLSSFNRTIENGQHEKNESSFSYCICELSEEVLEMEKRRNRCSLSECFRKFKNSTQRNNAAI